MKRGVAALNCNESRGRLCSVLLLSLLTPFLGLSDSYYYWSLKYRSNGLLYAVRVLPSNFSPGYLWVLENFPNLEGSNPFKIKGTDPAVYVVPGILSPPFEADSTAVQNANNLFGSVSDPLDLNLFDYGSGLDSGLPRLKESGTPILDNTGKPVGVVGYDKDGEKVFLPTVDYNGGYAAVGYDQNGNQGVYYISPGTDGMFPTATFTPSGGSSDSGNSSINTNSAPPVSDNIPPVQTDGNGNVSTPSTTVSVPDGSGGTVNIIQRDYTPLLSQIAKNQIDGINRVDENFSILNSNLQTVFGVDSVSEVAPNTEPTYDSTSSSNEVASVLEQVSGWGYNFGLQTNPIGNLITSLIGNPPTSFGKVDAVWDVDFTIYEGLTVHSSFKLSDYFIPAFRSCILFIISIVFAIAVAHQISKAWS